MTIAREEIFGPVLSVITCKDAGEAISIANDSQYGSAGASVDGPARGHQHGQEDPHRDGLDQRLPSPQRRLAVWRLQAVGRGQGAGHMHGLLEYTIAKHIHVAMSANRSDRFIWDTVLP